MSSKKDDIRVLIAGVGGGSLGMEIFKCLQREKGYELFASDISNKAFGLYQEGFTKSFLVPPVEDSLYAKKLLELCLSNNIEYLAPGAEKVHSIISDYRGIFLDKGIKLLINSKNVVDLCSKKLETLAFLKKNGIPIPETKRVETHEECASLVNYPYIVKPSEGSGASNLVFLAEDEKELLFFVDYLQKRSFKVVVQQYIDSKDEFTIGVLSHPEGSIIGSIALRRFLESKLSISSQYNSRIISSGWSQGEIRDFPELRQQAERIAKLVDSRWALNIQGRLGKDGIFYPFEINPRHSGTSYLRALAGFNELHYMIQLLAGAKELPKLQINEGFYIRGLTEEAISVSRIMK
jgi:carbamoyl-phosphate synthase large subunit